MPRLIDADALMRAVMAQDVVDKSVVKRLIIQAPTVDAVEVVRCGDCKHRTELCGDGWLPCTDMAVNNYWYCADGERKSNEAN